MKDTRINPLKARLAIGVTREALAEKIPCGIATVFRCEREKRLPSGRALRAAYIRALGMTEAGAQ